ncbi:MAG: PQQ-binding-like beta-propeller repeat protein [Phycisphaerales bacterium]|jgi:outer membrane protein assembly factor BamB|nr:PQQ-binding-like beta-propeller repeat protein [Phycisphaerales bacterium]
MKRTLLSLLIVSSVVLAAADSTKFLGPTGDGHHPQVNSIGKQLWTKTLGVGYSNVSVVGDKLYTAGFDGTQGVIYCLNATTGKELWTYKYPTKEGKYKGTRSTPMIADGKLYFTSRISDTYCLDATTGKKIWSVSSKKVRVKEPTFGSASSALIYNGLCIVNLGRAVAFDAKTGKVKWYSRTEYTKAYNTPRTLTIGGNTMLVITTYEGIVTIDPKTGKTLDLFKWTPPRIGTTITVPVAIGKDQIFISTAYNTGCAMLKVSPEGNMTQVWKNMNLNNHMANSMLFAKEGYLVGFHGNTNAKTPLVAMDVKTGKVLWKRENVGSGNLIKCGTNLLVIGYTGKVELLKTTREGCNVLQSLRVFNCTPCWTSPLVAQGKAWFRSNAKSATTSTLVCHEVK